MGSKKEEREERGMVGGTDDGCIVVHLAQEIP